MDRLLRDTKTILFFLLPVLIVYSVTVPLPVISSVLLGMTEWNLISPLKWVGLRNFAMILTQDFIFYGALRNTLFYAVLSVSCCSCRWRSSWPTSSAVP